MIVSACQRSIYAMEGSLNKFVVDDKGVLLLACFGLPPLSHFGDDPVRATIASMRMLDVLKAEGCTGQCGVATGQVWCGVIGNQNRKEYTVLGDVVNPWGCWCTFFPRITSSPSSRIFLMPIQHISAGVCRAYLDHDCISIPV